VGGVGGLGLDVQLAVQAELGGQAIGADQRRIADRQAAGGRVHRQERLPPPERRGAGLDQLAGDAGSDRVAVVGGLERTEAAIAGEARLQLVL
jgi:hypothetical protein